MTNAREPTAQSLQFVGVDMAQQAFEWAVHGVPGTHSVPNDKAGFETFLEALKNLRIAIYLSASLGPYRAGRPSGSQISPDPLKTPGHN